MCADMFVHPDHDGRKDSIHNAPGVKIVVRGNNTWFTMNRLLILIYSIISSSFETDFSLEAATEKVHKWIEFHNLINTKFRTGFSCTFSAIFRISGGSWMQIVVGDSPIILSINGEFLHCDTQSIESSNFRKMIEKMQMLNDTPLSPKNDKIVLVEGDKPKYRVNNEDTVLTLRELYMAVKMGSSIKFRSNFMGDHSDFQPCFPASIRVIKPPKYSKVEVIIASNQVVRMFASYPEIASFVNNAEDVASAIGNEAIRRWFQPYYVVRDAYGNYKHRDFDNPLLLNEENKINSLSILHLVLW